MGYNDGVFSLFNQGVSVSNRYADLQAPVFSPPSGVLYQSVSAKTIAPTILTTVSGSISSAYAQQITASITVSSAISAAYGLNIAGPLVQAGTVSNGYSLYVATPNPTSGNITNQIGAFFGLPTVGVQTGGVGIGTTTPTNSLDVSGGVAVGVYAGSQGVSSGVLAVSGSLTTTQGVGVGTSNPAYYLDVQGTLQARSAYGWMPQGRQQKNTLAQTSTTQMSSPGTNRFVCANTISLFDFTTINSLLSGYNTAAFDGRYVYYLPRFNSTLNFFGIIVRYDTSLPFASSTSYSIYDLKANVNSNSISLGRAGFDGRYLYMASGFGVSLTPLTIVTRYDTALPFNSTLSYSVFNTFTVNTAAGAYFPGGIFDGQYIYIVSDTSYSSVWGRYNTTAPFGSTQSWSFFDLLSVVAIATSSSRVVAGTFDGRYVYLNPDSSASVSASVLTRYDTTLPFSVSTSYQTFNIFQITGNNTSLYSGGVFDGRYYYLSPDLLTSTLFSSQMLRYDTTLSFTSSVSYALFDAQSLNTIAFGLQASIYDGRFVYYTSATFPSIFGLIITYDTWQPWGMSASYSVFDFSTLNSASKGYAPGVYDGVYAYWTPVYYSMVARTACYPSTPMSPMAIGSQALNGFTLGSGISLPQTSGTAAAGPFPIPSLPAGYIQFTGSRGGIVKIPYF